MNISATKSCLIHLLAVVTVFGAVYGLLHLGVAHASTYGSGSYQTCSYQSCTPPTATSLGPTNSVDGNTSNQATPTLTFQVTTGEGGTTVAYELQLSTSSDYSSSVLDYTSSQGSGGSLSFSVGQAAGSGTYTTGSAGQSLSNGSYYWRVQATDNTGAVSGWTTANSGVAFIIYLTAPNTPTITNPTNGTTLNSNSPTLTSSTYVDSGSSQTASQWILSTHSNFSSPVISTGDDSSDLTSLATSALSNSIYYAEVRYKNAAGTYSGWSTPDSFTIDIPPAAPTNLIATASATSETTVNLTWTDPSASDLSVITIYRSTNFGVLGSSIGTAMPGTQAYSDTSAPFTTVYYTLIATDSFGGASPNSSQVSATPNVIASTLLLVLPGQSFTANSGISGSALNQVAGVSFNITVYAVDSSNRLAPSSLVATTNGTDGSGSYGSPTGLVSGTNTLAVTLNSAGSQTISVSGAGVTSGSQSLTVDAASQTINLNLEGLASGAMSRSGISLQIYAVGGSSVLDTLSNLGTGSSGTLTFTNSSALSLLTTPHDVYITEPGYLRYKISGVTLPITGTQPLILGDMNGDNQISLSDLVLAIAGFNGNGDSTVTTVFGGNPTLSDLVIMIYNYNTNPHGA